MTYPLFQSLLVGDQDATITSENIFRSSSTDAIVFNCGPLTIDASLVLETFSVGPGFSL